MQFSLDLQTLARAYADTTLTPLDVIDALAARAASSPLEGVFIEALWADARVAASDVMARRARGESMRLYGIPFAIKDNIDLVSVNTTAACPAFAYRAERSARVVERLVAEGAIPVGKTNLDQFATGLVGTRSPYGIPKNPFDARYISGGSSSGSAVAVARGLCSFALGTDTAGSGRVPAAFNNVVGLKPTRGMLSTRGVVPACRSLDCVSVFALTVDDAAEIGHLLAGFDAHDPYARVESNQWDPRPGALPPHFRFAVPAPFHLTLDDQDSRTLFAHAVAVAAQVGGTGREIDFAPFSKAGALLYDGAWVAERLEAAGALFEHDRDALNPAVRTIFETALPYRATDAFSALHELFALRNTVDPIWNDIDFLIVPSAPAIYPIERVLAEPIALNARLGIYANFVNLLDLCALAIPAGFRPDGLPFGITLIARRGRDALLASVGRALHAALVNTLGATGHAMPALPELPVRAGESAMLAVVGAHLSGEPLNRELTDLGARLVRSTRTSARYRLFALPTTPPKPGLVRVADGQAGGAIELEVWELSNAALGHFMRGVRMPLCIGTVELEDGSQVLGFLCEGTAVEGQREITSFGGWRAFRKG
jgi:allophanate hydrolase